MDIDMDNVMIFDEKSAKDRYIYLFCRVFSEESYVSGDEIIVKSKDKQIGKLRIKDVCSTLEQKFDSLRSKIDDITKDVDLKENNWEEALSNSGGDTKKNSYLSAVIALIAISQKAERKVKSNNPYYTKLKKKIDSNFQYIKDSMSAENRIGIIGIIIDGLLSKNASKKALTTLFSEEATYSVDEAYDLIKKTISREECQSNIKINQDFVINNPTELLKKLEKNGYVIADKSINFTPNSIRLCNKDLNYEERFLGTRSCVRAYLYGLMDLEHLKRNFDICHIFDERYLVRNSDKELKPKDNRHVFFLDNEDGKYTYKDHADTMMQILEDVAPEQKYSQGFWNYYMNGILTKEQIEKSASKGWIDLRDVCKEYIQSQELDENYKKENKDNRTLNEDGTIFYYDNVEYIFDDDEKIFEFFSPNIIAACIFSYDKDENINKFINQYLKEKYIKHGRDLSEEVYQYILENVIEDSDSAELKVQNIVKLYTNNYIGIDQIKNHPLLEDELEELKKQGIENRILTVDLYNNSLVNQDDIFEAYEENDVFDMINSGMNPSVLNGYYSTQEIINFILTNKINNSLDLSSLRQGINIEDIKRMYQAERSKDDNKLQMINGISYDDLNMLVTCGIITKEEADEIDQAYDYNSKIEKLMEQGLIVGDKNGTKVARNEGDGSSIPGTGYGPGKIDEWDKYKLLSALDEDSIELELNSDVLENYSLIIMPNNKIAIMEPTEDGHGASYVMSIKLALEQISNSENIDKEEIVDPLKEYANRTGIRSIPGMEIANHGENWGYNLKKKMENIHPNINELIYSKDKDEQEKNTRMAKIEKMQKKIQAKYLQAREKAKNINNVEVE